VLARDDDGQLLPLEQLQDNALMMAWAGHDTTSTALARALWLLHNHPQVRRAAAVHARIAP
jgi:cytochrome P450